MFLALAKNSNVCFVDNICFKKRSICEWLAILWNVEKNRFHWDYKFSDNLFWLKELEILIQFINFSWYKNKM